MNTQLLLLIGMLVLNVLISIWNCYAVGTVWKDVQAIGGWFERAVLWSAVVQSGVGFSMPILLGLGLGIVTYLTNGDQPAMSPEEGAQMMQAVMSLWYVGVIFPILGTGFVIWAFSIREAYRRRDFTSFAVAGWNTYAQIHNTLSAVNNLGSTFGNVVKYFETSKGNKGLTVILIVVVSLLLGFMIAVSLVRFFARRADSRIEQYAESLK